MKRIWDSRANCMMAIDGEYEFEMMHCGRAIRRWKQLYFRKNAKVKTKIMLRCWYAPEHPDFWKYYLELYRNGKMISQDRICQEAYDILKGEKHSDDIHGQVEFVILATFEPNFIHA